VWAPDGEIVTAVEIERGLAVPVQSYAVQESAYDAGAGHRGPALDDLWRGFADVAAANPHAWDPSPAGGDRVIATPYRRRHVSQWNVDMGVAVLLCAAEVADAVGVPGERRVHPWAVVDANAMVPLTGRAELHRSPAVAVVGRRLAERTGVAPAAVDHLDLYSCFPSAVRIQAAELGIALDVARPPTVTGGMAFGGGPLNSAALHALASMVDVLRDDPGSTGLVTAVSGMLTKQGAVVLSTEPPPGGRFTHDDVADDALAATATVEVDADHNGPATVDGVTVVHDREEPALAVVVATTDTGRRAVATGRPSLARGVGDTVEIAGGALVG
jgi:acetyl-CoA C-acetyltransferase